MTCNSSRNVLATGLAAGIGLAACSGVFPGVAEAQLPVRPDVLMSRVTTEVIAVLKRDAAAGQPTDVVRLVETKILPLFDFQHMTRIAVARNWRLASPEQQAALVAQFRTLLVRTYSSALSSYRDEDIDSRPKGPDPQTRLAPVPMLYASARTIVGRLPEGAGHTPS